MADILLTIAVAVISSGLLLGLVQLWVGSGGRHADTDATVVGTAHDVVELLREELQIERERRREGEARLARRIAAVEADLAMAHTENTRLRKALIQIRDFLRREFDHDLDFTDFGLPPHLDSPLF